MRFSHLFRTSFGALSLFISVAWTADSATVIGWRGDGTGVFPNTNPPLKWVPQSKWAPKATNVRWQTQFENAAFWSNSQPIVVGKRVFVGLEPSSFACLDADTGAILWRKDLNLLWTQKGEQFTKDWALWQERDKATPERIKEIDAILMPKVRYFGDGCQERFLKGYSFATPVSDGERVYVKNSTGVLTAVDLEGNLVWMRDISYTTGHGTVSSPILFDGRLIVWRKKDNAAKGYVLSAFEAKTGNPLWETTERPQGPGEGCATPIVLQLKNVPVVVTACGDVVRATDGQILAKEIHAQGHSTPTYHDDIVFFGVGDGHGKCAVAAVQLTLKDEQTVEAKELWKVTAAIDGKCGGLFGGMIYYDGYVYALQSRGEYYVIDAKTGTIAGSKLISKVDRVYGNLSVAGGNMYAFAMNGRGIVLKPGPQTEILAENPCLGSNTYSPFFVGDRMYIRNSRSADWMPGVWIRCMETEK